MIPEKATLENVNELEILYNNLNDYLNDTINYPGWKKDVYPTKATAIMEINDGNLYILKQDNKIVGSVALNHKPEKAYLDANWGIDVDFNNVLVVHTLVVDPNYMQKGIAKKLIEFGIKLAKEKKFKAIRLDVSIHNTPAIALYEKCGFKYVDTVDLELNIPNLKWFKLYEIIF